MNLKYKQEYITKEMTNCYYKYNNKNVLPLNYTDQVYDKILTLPLHPDLDKKELKYIIECLNEIISKNINDE